MFRLARFIMTKKIAVITVAAAAVLTIGLYFGFRPKTVEQEKFTAAESACLASLATQFEPLLAAQSTQQNVEMQQVIAAYGQNKSQPDFDTALALSDYKDKLTSVKIKHPILRAICKMFTDKAEKNHL